MQESYLHYLWRMRRFDNRKIKLKNEPHSEIIIHEVGWYNQDAGPDFFNGKISIDGIIWQGNIEIHIKSSDWYKHKHHLDKAYDNVILHVVYEFDKEVFIKGEALPTIELKSVINFSHFQYYQQFMKESSIWNIPCHKEVRFHDFALFQQINVSFLNRIERKGIEIMELTANREVKKILFQSILLAIGGKTNKIPFMELGNILDYRIVQKEKWNPLHLEALLFGTAGFLQDEVKNPYYLSLQKTWKHLKNKYQLQEMNKHAWKFGGVRPYSFPTLLLAQLSAFLQQIEADEILSNDLILLLQKINTMSPEKINTFWENHFSFAKEVQNKAQKFYQGFINNLIINGVSVFYVALKHYYNDFSYMEKAMQLLELLPPEENKITNYWRKIGIFPKNALESQGLIELKNEFCDFKKCLSCKVGISILENRNEKINSENSILL